MSTMSGKFLYFGFGSNLLRERLRLNNPSAVFKTIGKLQGYKLTFNFSSTRWGGAVATIVESPQDCVWGVVWELNKEDMDSLDRQEGVNRNPPVYKPLEVKIHPKEGTSLLHCRTYQMVLPWEIDRRPSPQYKQVMINGAIQNGLPKDYVEFLRNIEDNGYSEKVELFESIITEKKDQ